MLKTRMRRIQPVAEAEVIAEYLKNEFYEPEFHEDREKFENLVLRPDLANPEENAIRRELLFRRRGELWRELPHAIKWWEMQVEPADLDRMYVSDRLEWKRIANGSMLVKDIAERIQSGRFGGNSICKVVNMGYYLRNSLHRSSVLLIGVNEDKPLTILEGNHRVLAAVMVSPEVKSWRLRVIVGLSAQMNDCQRHNSNRPDSRGRVKNWLSALFMVLTLGT